MGENLHLSKVTKDVFLATWTADAITVAAAAAADSKSNSPSSGTTAAWLLKGVEAAVSLAGGALAGGAWLVEW